MNGAVYRWRPAATVGWSILLLAAAAVLLHWPEAAAVGVRRGLAVAAEILAPGLFPFLVWGGMLTRTGLCDRIGRWLARPMAWLGLPGEAAAALLIGAVGGYPAGASAVGTLCQNGRLTKQQAARVMTGCVNAGPGFCVATVGVGMLGSARAGWVLWAAHLTASLLTLLIGTLRLHRSSIEAPAAPQPARGAGQALVASITAAVTALLSMTGFVVAASTVLSLLSAASLPAAVSTTAACLLEVSNGCLAAATMGAAAPFWLGWCLGWGGLSVHGQVAALLPAGTLNASFTGARLLQTVLGGLLSWWWLRALPLSLPTVAIAAGWEALPSATSSLLGGVSLIAMCVSWLFCFKEKG